MEKSSLNIKSFRNLLSNQSKNYKIAPNNYHPTEVKLNGLSDDSTSSRSIEDIYSIKLNKVDSGSCDSDCDRRKFTDVVCGNFVRFVGSYNSSFCLTVLTPVASLDDKRAKLDFTYKNCSQINYFNVDRYQPDSRDSTNESNNVIPYTITLSAPLLIISFIILLISYLLFLLAICSQKYKIFYFAAGIGFIISGLLSLSGLIMFISVFKSEVYHKLEPDTSDKETLFTFYYGQSFMLYVIGFVVVELSGILNVCLFNRLQQIAQHNQNRFHLNNQAKPGPMDLEVSAAPAKMCQHHVPYPVLENGFLPQKRRCSLHSTPNHRNNLLSQQVTRFDEFNNHTLPTPFRRNASTSTLDLVGDNDGDSVSARSNHRAINTNKDKSCVGNKLDFNNICGMMRLSSAGKSKDSRESPHRLGRLKPAKNIYYIEKSKDDEPNIFIIDPSTVNKHKRLHQLQKSLEDVRIHKMNNSHTSPACTTDCDANIGWNFMDRNYYGSRTLPRDFARRNIRPGLDNLFNNAQPDSSEMNSRAAELGYRQCDDGNHNEFYPPPIGFAFHHSSFDELSSSKSNRAPCNMSGHVNFIEPPKEYQWPKVIPKSPSSFSMNSFRLQRQPPHNNWLDEIEYERRKSLNVFKEDVKSNFGTAV